MKGTLIASISGIRGIIGDGLDPEVLVKYASAFGMWCLGQDSRPTVVVGRDGRVTGEACMALVTTTLRFMGLDVIDAGMATTPTVEMAVIKEGATGGIILSASHNPPEWNALKLLNSRGEFLSPEEGAEVLRLADETKEYTSFDKMGGVRREEYLMYHIQKVLDLEFIDSGSIADAQFKIVVDGINSIGGVAIPALLRTMGIDDQDIVFLNCEPTGIFAHPAEPLPGNLTSTIDRVRDEQADIGIVVDPDADRLALIADGGEYVSEELTQVIAADFLWGFRGGPFVTNLSSSRAIEDVARKHGNKVFRSSVGEINVVKKMQEVDAILGGEGNGGIILPDLHYGRDALVGVAMILQHMVNTGKKLSEIRRDMPEYHMGKKKILTGDSNPETILDELKARYSNDRIDATDGLKIDFDEGWVHIRKSNTEPIMRVYSEAGTASKADELGERFVTEVNELAGKG
ncbi:MAG: phosphoglucosamine mutase [Rhodothermales bacterium]|nr:phosphoglucosamine mutase [Rhodothermales bacterium]